MHLQLLYHMCWHSKHLLEKKLVSLMFCCTHHQAAESADTRRNKTGDVFFDMVQEEQNNLASWYSTVFEYAIMLLVW
jgi:hypothetical protein